MLIKREMRRINFLMLAKVMGWLLMIEGGFMLVPMVVGLCYDESDWVPFGISAFITFATGFCLNNFIRPSTHSMGKREGFLLTAMVWVVFSLFGMLPFIFSHYPLGLLDSYFEAMAGFTTTGCSSFVDVSILSHAINLWRSLMQWIGGLGIILFTLAVLPMLNSSGGMQMFNAEVTGITREKIRPRISQTAMGLWIVYIVLTIICAILLWCGPMDLFDSVCHALTTLSTGGMSTYNEGPGVWQSAYVDIVISVFMFMGGINFYLLFFIVTGHFRPFKDNLTLRCYVLIVASCFIIYSISAIVNIEGALTLRDTIVDPIFQVLSLITSTGYMLPDILDWGTVVMTLFVPMMIFGGCAGSTSGGAKIDRLIVLVKYVRNSVRRTIQPNKITAIGIDGRILPNDTVTKTIAFLCFYAIIIFVCGMFLAWWHVPASDALFTVASCLTNLGASPQSLGGVTQIAALPSLLKFFLTFVMLIGRLEIFTILVLFSPSFWRR